MASLKEYIDKQYQNGVLLNKANISSIPLNAMQAQALQVQVIANHRGILRDPTKRNILVGNFLDRTRACFFNLQGTLVLDYVHLTVAFWSSIYDRYCTQAERDLLYVLLHYIGAEELWTQLSALISASKHSIVRPKFVSRDGVYVAKNMGKVPTMHLMSFIAAPEGYYSYVVDFEDKVRLSFWQDLVGLQKAKLDKAVSKTTPWMVNSSTTLENRLAPYILRGDFGNLTKIAIRAITQYQAGGLLAYRNGARGRKPITNFPFEERMYPTLQRVLDERIAMFENICRQNNLASEDAYIYYVSPYFFCYAVKNKYRGLFTKYKDEVNASMVMSYSERRFLQGTYL